jgi:hypothetical protein
MNSENLLAIDYAKFRSRPHDAVIRVYRDTGNVIEAKSTRAISKSGEVFLAGRPGASKTFQPPTVGSDFNDYHR